MTDRKRFKLRRHGPDGVIMEHDGLLYDLGPIDAALDIFADFLEECDYGEHPERLAVNPSA